MQALKRYLQDKTLLTIDDDPTTTMDTAMNVKTDEDAIFVIQLLILSVVKTLVNNPP